MPEMTASNWKTKFSNKQLEKKRLSDKICQRRTRQQSKEMVIETEQRISLLLAGEKGTLINRILDDNAALRAKVSKYRYRMKAALATMKMCLEMDDNTLMDVDSSLDPTDSTDSCEQSQPRVRMPKDKSSRQEHEDFEKIKTAMVGITNEVSIYVQLYKIIGHPPHADFAITNNTLFESLMTWKSIKGYHRCGPALLLDYFQLKQKPLLLTMESLYERVLSDNFFEDLLGNLVYGSEMPTAPTATPRVDIDQRFDMRLQRRATAYCAYLISHPWRQYLRSSLEYLTIFWGLYRYFMFLVFPTTENYNLCPPWRRPSSFLFQQRNYPGWIDLIMIPRLQEKLLENWQDYDPKDLFVKLVHGFEVRNVSGDISSLVRIRPNMSDIYLDEYTEAMLHQADTPSMNTSLIQDYPDLVIVFEEDKQSFGMNSASVKPSQNSKRNAPEDSCYDQDTAAKRYEGSCSAYQSEVPGNLLTPESTQCISTDDSAHFDRSYAQLSVDTNTQTLDSLFQIQPSAQDVVASYDENFIIAQNEASFWLQKPDWSTLQEGTSPDFHATLNCANYTSW